MSIAREFLDGTTRVLHQPAHCCPGAVGLMPPDAVEDSLVSRQRTPGQSGNADGGVEREEQRRVHDRAHLLEDVVVTGLHDGEVEADVRVIVGLVVRGRPVERFRACRGGPRAVSPPPPARLAGPPAPLRPAP